MKTDATEFEMMGAVMDVLRSKGPSSAGNITRKLMGAGLLPKTLESYALVKDALVEWLKLGRVSKAGNGKAVHWRGVEP